MQSLEKDQPVNWNNVINQIYEMIGTNTALFNKYGLILASRIKDFTKDTLIPPTIIDFLESKTKFSKELNVSNIECLVLEAEKENIVFTFGKNYNLMSLVSKDVNLAEFMPSITSFLKTLHLTNENEQDEQNKYKLSLEQEYNELQESTKKEVKKDRFPIFKHLIKYLSKK